jgi:hypothetical protein
MFKSDTFDYSQEVLQYKLMLIFSLCNIVYYYFVTILKHSLLEETSPFLLLVWTVVYTPW